MNLFGKKKQAPPPNPADAIMKLRGTMETLTKREAYIQKKIEMMVAEAKQKMVRKDKNGALFALKKKKMYEVSHPSVSPSASGRIESSPVDSNALVFTIISSCPKTHPQAEITKIQGAMMNLESQAMSLEGSATNMEVFGAMRTGAKAMGAMRGAMCVACSIHHLRVNLNHRPLCSRTAHLHPHQCAAGTWTKWTT